MFGSSDWMDGTSWRTNVMVFLDAQLVNCESNQRVDRSQ